MSNYGQNRVGERPPGFKEQMDGEGLPLGSGKEHQEGPCLNSQLDGACARDFDGDTGAAPPSRCSSLIAKIKVAVNGTMHWKIYWQCPDI
jgi:hypothetical protein